MRPRAAKDAAGLGMFEESQTSWVQQPWMASRTVLVHPVRAVLVKDRSQYGRDLSRSGFALHADASKNGLYGSQASGRVVPQLPER